MVSIGARSRKPITLLVAMKRRPLRAPRCRRAVGHVPRLSHATSFTSRQ
jgi:hypothetical protein